MTNPKKTKLKAKVKEVQSTHQARLAELETKSYSVVTADAPEPAVATVAAPTMEVTSKAPGEPAAHTPIAVEEPPTPTDVVEDAPTPAVDEGMTEEAKEVAVAERKNTEAGPTLEPGGTRAALEDVETTIVIIPEQNMKRYKRAPITVQDNQAAQVPETLSKMGPLLTDDDNALAGRAFPVNTDPNGLMSDGTKATTGAVNKPKAVEPCANADQASMTSHKASKLARPSTNPLEVAREGQRGHQERRCDQGCE
jgi:hypothetical protein